MKSWFDQLLFTLGCKHKVVVGRLQSKKTWRCEECQEDTDLTKEPFHTELVKLIDRALQMDLKAKEEGKTVVRESGFDPLDWIYRLQSAGGRLRVDAANISPGGQELNEKTAAIWKEIQDDPAKWDLAHAAARGAAGSFRGGYYDFPPYPS
jgi:hypothetical protein